MNRQTALAEIPTCTNCGKTVGVIVGLPVFVTFEGGAAIIEVDLSEVADDFTVGCACGEGDISDEDNDTLLELLHKVAEQSATAPNITLPL